MAARLRLFGNQLKSFWEEQPVIVISVLMGIAGSTVNYVLLNLEVFLMVECEINVPRVPEAQWINSDFPPKVIAAKVKWHHVESYQDYSVGVTFCFNFSFSFEHSQNTVHFSTKRN